LIPGIRLGTEMADRARFWGRVGGILHSDEFQSYGISKGEVEELRSILKAGDEDAIVIVADKKENCIDALRAVENRAKEAIRGVPEETRAANPDGTTRYMRPRPGAARMYPETDVPPIPISNEYIERLRMNLPEMPERKVERLIREYGINEKLARQLQDSEYGDLFETIVKETGVPSTFVAATLTETLKSLKREGFEIERLSKEQIIGAFRLVGSGRTSKEAISEIFKWLSRHEGADPEEAIKELGLAMLSKHELQRIVKELVEQNRRLIFERGERAFGPLMGMIMKKYRGRVDARMVSALIKEEISRYSGDVN